MKSYDIDYYSGASLRMPEKPTKPRLKTNPTAVEARAYADALEEYESEMRTYKENLGWYHHEQTDLLIKFQNKLREDYGLHSTEFDVIWDEAHGRSHSYGLQEVYYEFDRLYDFVKKYTNTMKGL